ncbi:MAG: hypothetical protein COA88_14665 [Kordia sp.]|nr:MAG: hypothetical protein COA88_14665 [Kordia sp.]
MNFTRQSFVTSNEILADVLKVVGDVELRFNSKGYYVSQIQQALEELSFDTFFDERNESFDISSNLRVELPKGAFNIKQVYLFRGDDCNFGSQSQIVYHKRNFINDGSGNNYVARDKYNNDDPFYRSRNHSVHDAGHHSSQHNNNGHGINNLFFYGIQQGVVMLSDSCRKFEKVMIVFNGMGADIGDMPVIPNFFRQAVKDFVSRAALDSIISASIGTPLFNQWQAVQNTISVRLEKPYDGSWAKAEHRLKVLDNKHREDLKEYLSSMDY